VRKAVEGAASKISYEAQANLTHKQKLDRRHFLGGLRAGTAALLLPCDRGLAAESGSQPEFTTDHPPLQEKYDAALATLRSNTLKVNRFPNPALIEGGSYAGVWLEGGPQEGQVYGLYDPAVARANHEIFFDFQWDDGYLPCYVWFHKVGQGQIQMVVPIAATALEVFHASGDEAFLQKAYRACGRWDDWLARYRNTRGTGLCEAFCTYDTGHDNSPRWKGLPNQCPNNDARICPKVDVLPFLAPDLSATVYGGRVALAKMARLLGRSNEVAQWEQKAASIQKAIIDRLYDPEDACFYDLNARNQFVRIRGDALTRVLGEHVVGQDIFDQVYARQIHNPHAFWAPYPLPSIALDDPVFVRPIPRNSWGGASQALTALRAPRWLEHYGKPADLANMMSQWVKAFLAGTGFLQQLDPASGEFSADRGGYSPAALVMLDYTWRLHGVRAEAGVLEWNCRLPEGASRTRFSLPLKGGGAELIHGRDSSELSLATTKLLTVKGTARIVTDEDGKALRVAGVAPATSNVELLWPDGKSRSLEIEPNQVIRL
jgi:hypothetical protein